MLTRQRLPAKIECHSVTGALLISAKQKIVEQYLLPLSTLCDFRPRHVGFKFQEHGTISICAVIVILTVVFKKAAYQNGLVKQANGQVK